jgi:diacylglycerol kinase family enzyme
MRHAKLLHNPGAGSGQYDDLELRSMVKSNGFECDYSSVKEKDWEEISPAVDFLIIAGGDGTVKRTAMDILRRRLIDGVWPIALLPLGTANNIASTLDLKGRKPEELIRAWKENKKRKFDIGRLFGTGKTTFFMEGFGFGLFPYLIRQMKKREIPAFETPEQSMMATLEKFHELILKYEPKQCNIEVNGKDHSGKFLLAEVMNTQCIGPNMAISPDSNPSDGELEVVLIPENDKKKFADYIASKIAGNEIEYKFHTIKATKIKISWDGTHAHADDEVLKLKKAAEIRIEIRKGVLEFLVP